MLHCWDTGYHSDFRHFECHLPLDYPMSPSSLWEAYRNCSLSGGFQLSLCCALTWVFSSSWVPSRLFQHGYSFPSVLGKRLALFPLKISYSCFLIVISLLFRSWTDLSNFYPLSCLLVLISGRFLQFYLLLLKTEGGQWAFLFVTF